MPKWTAWLLCGLVLLASAQCFVACVGDSCAAQHSCHKPAKACAHQELVADDSAASMPHFAQSAGPALPITSTLPALIFADVTIRPLLISTPIPISSSIVILKI